MEYLSKFKWHQLKEGSIYNRQVRKARLQQKIGQARKENEFFLEKIEQAKALKRISERRAAAVDRNSSRKVKEKRSRDEPPSTFATDSLPTSDKIGDEEGPVISD